MLIYAIDPGPKESAVVCWDGKRVVFKEEYENKLMVAMLKNGHLDPQNTLVIEWISGFGVPAGNDTFETCRWVGRFEEAWRGPVALITRKKVKEHLQAVNDKFVRQALIHRFGEPGSKKSPGILYGVKGHCLAALAVAVTWWDKNGGTP